MNPFKTTFMTFEHIEPMTNPATGEVTRAAFWKCTKSNNFSRQLCEDWARMPVTQGGYVRDWLVVELPNARAHMIRDEAIADEAFEYSVLRHDLTRKVVAA